MPSNHIDTNKLIVGDVLMKNNISKMYFQKIFIIS